MLPWIKKKGKRLPASEAKLLMQKEQHINGAEMKPEKQAGSEDAKEKNRIDPNYYSKYY